MPNGLLEIIFPSCSHNDVKFNSQIMSCDDLIASFQNNSEINTILTTDSERLIINGKNIIEPVLPFENLKSRLIERARDISPDLIIISHSFFNSGMAFNNFDSFIEVISALTKYIIVDLRISYLYLPLELNLQIANLYLITQNYNSTTSAKFDFQALKDAPYFHETKELIRNFRGNIISWDHSYFCEKNIVSVDYNYHGPILAFAMPSFHHAQKYKNELELKIKDVFVYQSRLIVDFRKTNS